MKRTCECVVSALALACALPVLAAIAAAIFLTMGRPVFFRQLRSGFLGRPFTILKFRTMLHTVDAEGVPLPDGERLQPLGSFLRRTSLDELPELWNVLRGEMSLVGPRPFLTRYLPFYFPKRSCDSLCGQALRDGRKSTAATMRRGMTACAMTSGMSKTKASRWMCGFSA